MKSLRTRSPKVRLLFVLAMLGALHGWVANARLINYVIHVSVDGLRPDAVTNLGPTNLPNFYRLRTEGTFTDNARTDYDYTETLPNHTTQLTGRGVLGATGHNWTENVDPPAGATLTSNKGSYVAGIFDVVHDNGLRTGEYASKSKFSLFDTTWNEINGALDGTSPDNGRDKIDNYVNTADMAPLVNTLAADMKAQALHYAFIHFAYPDTIGHGHGWDPTPGSAYSDAVKSIDDRLGVIFGLVTTNAQFAGRTAIILTTDHGGTGTAHAGSGTMENYTIPFYVWGPGVAAGASLYTLNPANRLNPGTGRPNYSAAVQPVRNGEAANVALKLLGLPPVPGSTIGQAQDLALNASPGPAPAAPVATAATSVINCGFAANWNSVSGATGYLLDVSTNSAFTSFVSGYQDIVVGNPVNTNGAGVLSYNVTGLKATTTHYYRVWACNANGTSGMSGTISATTTANLSSPSAPNATAATGVTSTGFTANWNIACGATGYRLDVSTDNTFSSYVAGYQDLNVGNVTSRILSELSSSTTFYYRVRAFNGIGASGNSGIISATTTDINSCIASVLLKHGNMEDATTYSVCPDWSSYGAGNGAPSWAKETTIVHGGAASQRARNINGGAGSLLGVQQTFDANVGDAFTIEGWVNQVSNPTYAQAAMAVRWDGATALPDATATWKISAGPRNVWTQLQGLSGNATATSVTLFLDSRRKSGSIDITAYWDDVVSYRAYAPPSPTLNSANSTSLDVNVNAGCNSTNGAAQFAVSIGGGAYTLGTHWVQANGTVGMTPVWQSDATWATKTVTGLAPGVPYTFKEQARYSGTYPQPTSFGAGATLAPQAPPTLPPVITQQPTDQTVAPDGTGSFTVLTGGSQPLSYQWQKNSNNLANGGHYSGCLTNTLMITSADNNDVASYRCVVTNAYGSTNSSNATLTVTVAAGCNPVSLVNGGFESGNAGGVATGWTGYQRTPNPTTAWSIQIASPPQGLQYQQIANTSSTGGGGVRQDVTGCVIGTTYTISGWMRGNSASATCTVKCSPTASTSWATAGDLNPPQTYTGGSWAPISGTVIATGTNLTLWLDGQTGGTAQNKAECFDSVTVTCLGSPTPLRFESATLLAQQQMRLILSGPAGSTVKIRSSSNLVNWVDLANLTNTSGTLEFTDSSPTNTPRRFYRATSP